MQENFDCGDDFERSETLPLSKTMLRIKKFNVCNVRANTNALMSGTVLFPYIYLSDIATS